MSTQIQIQRSTGTNEPTLQFGELGYTTAGTDNCQGDTGNDTTTTVGGYLYIGDNNSAGSNLRIVGGDHYIRMLNHTAGTLTGSSAIITDASSKVNQLLTTNITVGASNLTFGAAADMILPASQTAGLEIKDDSATFVTFDTTNDTINFGQNLTGSLLIADNTAAPLKFASDAGDDYMTFVTTDGSEKVCVHQTLDTGSQAMCIGDLSANSGVFSEASATLTIQNTQVENTTDGGRETDILFKDNSGNEMAKIRGEHDGTANDAKGNLKFFTGTSGTNSGSATAIEALEIDSAQKSIFKGAVDIGTGGSAENLTVYGNLDVKGTTTTIDSTTVTVDDKNIELGSVTTPTDATATGGGITLKGATDKTLVWDTTNNNWTFNTGAVSGALNLDGTNATDYKIANTSVLNATTLGSGVVTSSLTTVGALDSGSITANFGAIDNGTSNITSGGIIKVDVDGTDKNAAGSITLGAGNDAGIYVKSDNLNINNGTQTLEITAGDVTVYDVNGSASPTISLGKDVNDDLTVTATTDASSRLTGVEFNTNSTGTFTRYSFDEAVTVATGKDYQINDVSVLNATTLGSSVVTSSLTTVGALDSGSITANFGAIDNGTSNITTGGLLKIDVDGTAIGEVGSLTLGTGADAGIWVDSSDNLNINNGTNTIEMVAGDVTIFDTNTNAHPSISLGSEAADALKISMVNKADTNDMSLVHFETAGTDTSTANIGAYKFSVQGTHIASIDDSGITGGASTMKIDNFTIDGGTFS